MTLRSVLLILPALAACTAAPPADPTGGPPELDAPPGAPDAEGKADSICYRCADYGFAAGECDRGWLCDGECIRSTGCTEDCRYPCAVYGYTEGFCHDGWECNDGCITHTGCSAPACPFPCADYGYDEGACHGGWLCTDGCIEHTGCVEPDETPAPEDPAPDTGDCPAWECTGSGCTDLVQLPGSADPSSDQARADGYYVATERRYSFIRRDLAKLVAYAACMVQRRYPGLAPIGISDLSQADGLTPGSDMGSPRHPTSTHTGRDMDLAYIQTDGTNNPQIVCGDGTDTNGNGVPGRFNDGYFCTTDESIVDWDKEAYWFAMLATHPGVRVFGVDQTMPDHLSEHVDALRDAGAITAAQHDRALMLGYGAAGGWQFHHHHSHMSYR